MKIGIIGPSNIDRVGRAAGVDPARIREESALAGALLAAAGHELVVVPDRGVAVIAAEAYRKAGGTKIWGFIPSRGRSAEGATSRVERNSALCDTTFRDLTWHEQHSRLVEFADAMLCVGMSCGTVCEIAWTKWTKRIPVLVVESLSSRLPPEIEAETEVRYVTGIRDAVAVLGSGLRGPLLERRE